MDTASKSASKKVSDKSSKSAGPHAQQQDPKESQPEVQEVDGRADASGSQRKRRATTASDTQKPWTGRAKPKRVYCPACTKRKSEPGENGHPRQNAIHKCPDCAELTRKGASEQPEQSRGKKKEAGKSAEPEPERSQSEEGERREGHEGELAFLRSSVRGISYDGGAKRGSDQPEQSAPGKRKLRARPHKPRQKQDNGSGLSTQSDDPGSLPTPNDDNPQVEDVFGSTSHFSDPGASSSPDVDEVAPGFFSVVQDPPPAVAWPVHSSLIDPAFLEGTRPPELRHWSGNPMLTGETPPLTVEQAPGNSGPVLTGNNNENSGDNYGNDGGWAAAEAAAEAEEMFKPYIYPEP